MSLPASGMRLGLDLGGTKIEGVVLDGQGTVLAKVRQLAPRGSYDATLEALRDVVAQLERQAGVRRVPTGLGIPGSISRRTGRVQNANSTWINGRDLTGDLKRMLDRPVRITNDANCFALSEATDGAGAGADTVFGVILGTGTGAGIVHRARILDGPLGIGGEWGHNPLPWPEAGETPGPACWCGRRGCMETWVSGPGLAADYARATGEAKPAEAIVADATAGEAAAEATLNRHAGRLARGLAHVVNILDPGVIVLGGGLSQLSHLYAVLPALMRPHIFCDDPAITVAPPRWGDASGVRGAAWLAATDADEA